MENKIFIIPTQETKPIKIVYEELPCPVLLNLEIEHRCKYAESKVEDMNYMIFCSAEKCECIKIKID